MPSPNGSSIPLRGPRSRLIPSCVGPLLAALVLVAGGAVGCGGDHGETSDGYHGARAAAERFGLGRSREGFFRFDSRNGRVWAMPFNGDGGWVELGTPPDLAGLPATEGRFEASSIGPIRDGGLRKARGDDSVAMIRFDHATGRTWLLETDGSQGWVLAADRDAPPEVPAATTGSATAPATGGGEADRPVRSSGTSQAMDEDSDKTYPILTGDQLGTTPEERQQSLQTLHAALTKEGLPRKMRLWAVRQIAELDAELAGPELVLALEDEDPAIVAEAVRQLGRVGRPSTIPAILKLQNHPDPEVRKAVSETIVQVR